MDDLILFREIAAFHAATDRTNDLGTAYGRFAVGAKVYWNGISYAADVSDGSQPLSMLLLSGDPIYRTGLSLRQSEWAEPGLLRIDVGGWMPPDRPDAVLPFDEYVAAGKPSGSRFAEVLVVEKDAVPLAIRWMVHKDGDVAALEDELIALTSGKAPHSANPYGQVPTSATPFEARSWQPNVGDVFGQAPGIVDDRTYDDVGKFIDRLYKLSVQKDELTAVQSNYVATWVQADHDFKDDGTLHSALKVTYVYPDEFPSLFATPESATWNGASILRSFSFSVANTYLDGSSSANRSNMDHYASDPHVREQSLSSDGRTLTVSGVAPSINQSSMSLGQLRRQYAVLATADAEMDVEVHFAELWPNQSPPYANLLIVDALKLRTDASGIKVVSQKREYRGAKSVV